MTTWKCGLELHGWIEGPRGIVVGLGPERGGRCVSHKDVETREGQRTCEVEITVTGRGSPCNDPDDFELRLGRLTSAARNLGAVPENVEATEGMRAEYDDALAAVRAWRERVDPRKPRVEELADDAGTVMRLRFDSPEPEPWEPSCLFPVSAPLHDWIDGGDKGPWSAVVWTRHEDRTPGQVMLTYKAQAVVKFLVWAGDVAVRCVEDIGHIVGILNGAEAYRSPGSVPPPDGVDDILRSVGVSSEQWAETVRRIATETEGESHRRFVLNRRVDVSGVSGSGVVAVGVEFPSGRCVLEWLPGKAGVRSFNIYENTGEIEKVNGHEGRTVIEWVDAPRMDRTRRGSWYVVSGKCPHNREQGEPCDPCMQAFVAGR